MPNHDQADERPSLHLQAMDILAASESQALRRRRDAWKNAAGAGIGLVGGGWAAAAGVGEAIAVVHGEAGFTGALPAGLLLTLSLFALITGLALAGFARDARRSAVYAQSTGDGRNRLRRLAANHPGMGPTLEAASADGMTITLGDLERLERLARAHRA